MSALIMQAFLTYCFMLVGPFSTDFEHMSFIETSARHHLRDMGAHIRFCDVLYKCASLCPIRRQYLAQNQMILNYEFSIDFYAVGTPNALIRKFAICL